MIDEGETPGVTANVSNVSLELSALSQHSPQPTCSAASSGLNNPGQAAILASQPWTSWAQCATAPPDAAQALDFDEALERTSPPLNDDVQEISWESIARIMGAYLPSA
mmetsp:Transcript_41140/g.66674  ORF Transcript_41140/g.66674 Transcript_41140/m.66674 type:complete len:108 (-) Transcript_41140:125-448(-)